MGSAAHKSRRNLWRALLAAFAFWLAAPAPASAQTARAFPFPNATPAPAAAATARNPEAAATVVVYNNLDSLSLELAAYYAEKRGIPLSRLIGLDCSGEEEISRAEFDRTIAEPLRKVFTERGWWSAPREADAPVMRNSVRFLALMRGVPLKISQAADYPGDSFSGPSALNRNEASVDSELAVLGLRSRQISGPLKNPYYRSFTAFLDAGNPALMLVCRLDAPTGPLVKRMIDDAVAAEKNGLWGFAYIDSRGTVEAGLAEGEKWLADVAKDTRTHGIPTIVDNLPAMFPTDYPMRNAALYFGWYGENASGPFSRPDFRLNQGAIACHIHSFSGATVRDPRRGWVAPLIAHGAAATLGNVYEPYLAFTPNLDVFEDRLRNGFTFAESAYMSERVLSWMTTFVGDPLYRPFKPVPDGAASAPKSAAEWIAYRDGADVWFRENRAAGEKKLSDAARRLRSGIVWEGLGLLQWQAAADAPAAITSFAQAEKAYANPEDATRTVIHSVRILMELQKKKEALALARRGIKSHSKTPAANMLRAVVDELAPPPSPAPTPRPLPR